MNEDQKEKFIVMQEDVKRLKEDTSEIKALLKNHCDKESKLLEELDKKYASKLTEKIVYTMVGIILTTVLAIILVKVGITK